MLTELQRTWLNAFTANGGDTAKACELAGCSRTVAYRWLSTHPDIQEATKGLRRWQINRDAVVARLWGIARRPSAQTKGTYHSQVSAMELIARIEGWIHEPAPSATQVNVKVGENTADPAKYAALANAQAALAGDAMPALGAAPGDQGDADASDGDDASLPVG